MSSTTIQMLSDQITAQAEQFDAIYGETDPYDTLYEAPLGVRVRRQLVVVLCAGGPHVEAVATLDDDGTVTDARLDGCWGSACESRPVSRSSSLWRALEDYAENLIVG